MLTTVVLLSPRTAISDSADLRISIKNGKICTLTYHAILFAGGAMGKYIGYAACILVALFFLEWFQIIDIPFVDLPDFTSGKKELIEKSGDSLEQRFGD
jgi:hypothetical protein